MSNQLSILFNEEKISGWASLYCRDVKNDPEIREFITDSKEAFYYCKDINDDPKVRKNITDPLWAYYYCLYINDNPKIRKIAEKGGYKL